MTDPQTAAGASLAAQQSPQAQLDPLPSGLLAAKRGSGSLIDPLTLPGVLLAADQAREALADLHRHPAARRDWSRIAAAAGVRSARASAALDGAALELDPQAGTVTDPVLAGALRVSAALGGLERIWLRSPLQALARLHVLAAADLVVGQHELGRPVVGAQRLAALASCLVSRRWPAPVAVSIVHGELLTLRPFGSADGVVARAAARLTAVATGLDPHALGVSEVAMLRAGSAYQELAAGYPAGDTHADGSGLAAWLVAGSSWLVAGAGEGRSIADAL